jgi:hypothetical protein
MPENRKTHRGQSKKTWRKKMALSYRGFGIVDMVFDPGRSQTQQGALSLPAGGYAVSLGVCFMAT